MAQSLTTPRLLFSTRALSPKLAVHLVRLRLGFGQLLLLERDPGRVRIGAEPETIDGEREIEIRDAETQLAVRLDPRGPRVVDVDAALAALEMGKAVLVEKPLATNYKDAKLMVVYAQDKGVPLMPGHIERFNPAIVELRRRLHRHPEPAHRQRDHRARSPLPS